MPKLIWFTSISLDGYFTSLKGDMSWAFPAPSSTHRGATRRLIDELQLVVLPLVLGSGKSLFTGAKGPLRLTRSSARTFGNGNVVLTYAPKG